jgi:hypothetical protein
LDYFLEADFAYVDRKTALELVIKYWTERSKDTFESLDPVAEIETLFPTLEERLLYLGVLPRWVLTKNVVKEVDCIDVLSNRLVHMVDMIKSAMCIAVLASVDQEA